MYQPPDVRLPSGHQLAQPAGSSPIADAEYRSYSLDGTPVEVVVDDNLQDLVTIDQAIMKWGDGIYLRPQIALVSQAAFVFKETQCLLLMA